MTDQEPAPDRAAILEQIRKQSLGGQIPAKEIYQPDPTAKSHQGPLEVARATFANYRMRKGSHA